MKNNKLTIGILVFCIVVIIIVFGIFVYFDGKDNKEKVILNADNRNLYSIMLEQTRGMGDYLESSETTWPADGYTFNENNSGCVDSEGNIIDNSITYDAAKNMIIAKAKEINYCYVYFDIY